MNNNKTGFYKLISLLVLIIIIYVLFDRVLPGYGLTGPFPDRDYGMDHYVEFVDRFLRKLGVTQCILGGNSLGGNISWRYTLQHPEKVKKLILIDASGYPSQSKDRPLAFKLAELPLVKNIFTFITPRFVARSSVENVYVDKSKVTDSLVDRYFELTLRAGNRQAFVDRLGVEHSSDHYQNISSIRQPTLILWGEQDDLIPVDNAIKFHKDLPNNTLEILRDVGHVPMEESPKKSLKIVQHFLTESYHEAPY
jgi:pimeloyl-ACP methyl ester carboxylesterase